MIHQYRLGGYNIVIDVCSGAIHVVDEVAYDIISLFESNSKDDILSKIAGVGNVDVLLTYNETEEIIPIYNTKDKTSVTNETDSTGGTRVTQESDSSREVIYQNDEIIAKTQICTNKQIKINYLQE